MGIGRNRNHFRTINFSIMQEIIILTVAAIVIAAAGFWTGLCWSRRAWADMEERLRNQVLLNRTMQNGIQVRDSQIEQQNKTIQHYKNENGVLKGEINLLTAINSLPQ